jgi:riboflavin biosynthesis pyrimidine reductase
MNWPERFEQYERRRLREALAADIAPFVTEFDRADASFKRIGNDWSRRLFDGDFYVSPPLSPDLPSTSLVFVQSRDGNTVAKDPSSLGGGEADKHLIYEGLSRVAVDAVLMGAETVRGGNVVMSVWHPQLVALRASLGLPRHPIQIIATLRGMNLDTLIFNLPAIPVIVLTIPTCADLMLTGLADRRWITAIIMPTSRDLMHAFRELRQRGIATISCIGGRNLAGQLLDAGLIRDLYLTTSAQEAGEPNTPLSSKPIGGNTIVRKRGSGVDAGVVFEMISTVFGAV